MYFDQTFIRPLLPERNIPRFTITPYSCISLTTNKAKCPTSFMFVVLSFIFLTYNKYISFVASIHYLYYVFQQCKSNILYTEVMLLQFKLWTITSDCRTDIQWKFQHFVRSGTKFMSMLIILLPQPSNLVFVVSP